MSVFIKILQHYFLNLASSEHTRLEGFYTLLVSCQDNGIIYGPNRTLLQVKGEILKNNIHTKAETGTFWANQNMEPNYDNPTTGSPPCYRVAPFGYQCSFSQTSLFSRCFHFCIVCHHPPSPYILEQQNTLLLLLFTCISHSSLKPCTLGIRV